MPRKAAAKRYRPKIGVLAGSMGYVSAGNASSLEVFGLIRSPSGAIASCRTRQSASRGPYPSPAQLRRPRTGLVMRHLVEP